MGDTVSDLAEGERELGHLASTEFEDGPLTLLEAEYERRGAAIKAVKALVERMPHEPYTPHGLGGSFRAIGSGYCAKCDLLEALEESP
jgi:hypothetical protein